MRFITFFLSASLLSSTLYCNHASADSKGIEEKYVTKESVQDHYSKATEAYQNGQWDTLLFQSQIIKKNFPDTPFAQEATFFMGVSYFHKEEFELASRFLSNYLNSQSSPRYFEETIQYKFLMADAFREGAKKHLFGWQGFPKWMNAQDESIELYDEVITALPSHELAAQALYGKALVYAETRDYKEAIESYQLLIRRFPKHHLAPSCYMGIAQTYLKQCNPKAPDTNLLDFAEINLQKFKTDFPMDQRILDAEKCVIQMKEIYGAHLFETGRFYERTKKKHAAIIYYAKVISDYGDTDSAKKAELRLEKLGVDKSKVLKGKV